MFSRFLCVKKTVGRVFFLEVFGVLDVRHGNRYKQWVFDGRNIAIIFYINLIKKQLGGSFNEINLGYLRDDTRRYLRYFFGLKRALIIQKKIVCCTLGPKKLTNEINFLFLEFSLNEKRKFAGDDNVIKQIASRSSEEWKESCVNILNP